MTETARKRQSLNSVSGQITLKVRDFSKLGPLLGARSKMASPTFALFPNSLANEEAAKQKAVAEAMRRAVVSVSAGGEGYAKKMPPPPSPPIPQPEKITVSATVQCAFQIQP